MGIYQSGEAHVTTDNSLPEKTEKFKKLSAILEPNTSANTMLEKRLNSILHKLSGSDSDKLSQSAFAGLYGFVDLVQRTVKSQSAIDPECFVTIADPGRRSKEESEETLDTIGR